LQQAQAEYEAFFESAKICYPDIAKECSFAMDESGQYLANTCYFIPSDSYAVLGVLNSGAINWYYQFTTSEYRGGYQRSFTHAIRNIPIPEGLMEATGGKDEENLASLARELTELHERRHSLNLDLLDYLGNYQEGTKLPDIGLYQPAADSDSVLSEASEDNDDHLRLRIGDMRIVRKGKGSVLVEATARYRPDEDEDFVETDWKPAFRLTDLTETEVTLVEAFVPVVADEAGGFAGYREKATKTNTLLDRIEAITLPNSDDVVEDLERYKNAVERAEELDEKIQHTDDLLDEIVYDLYGLSDDEIDIIEDSINED